jgi:hypothetical protein
MPKKRPAAIRPPAKSPEEQKKWSDLSLRKGNYWRVAGPVILLLLTLACYWKPMTSSDTSVLWDAADYHQPVQDYLSQELHEGRVPFWTPYPWAGYPFLADPQVGAWYPFNWPFFASGVTSQTLFTEHWLHALWACLGAYWLALRLVRNRPGAVLAGLCYGLSGFYVGNAAHTGVLQSAAWTPWLLLLFDRALESNAVRNTLLGGAAAGLMILAGHFQTSLYTFTALGLFALARIAQSPRSWTRIAAVAAAVPVIGTLVSAVATVPGLELTVYSVRSSLKAITRTDGELPLKALLTLIDANFYGGVISGQYRGPFDITQYYFYAGVLMIPLAVLGLRNRTLRWMVVPMIVMPVWYAMGQSAGLYLLVARLPGFSSLRVPVNIWFVPSLGLALLAGAGLEILDRTRPEKWLAAVILVIFSVDLFYCQSFANQIAYGRKSYEETYGNREENFRQAILPRLRPLTRFEEPELYLAAGPISHFFRTRTEVTNGYGPLRLTRYADYEQAIDSNPTLRAGLSVGLWVDERNGYVRGNPVVLPRAGFPRELIPVDSIEQSKQMLLRLDQTRDALAPVEVAMGIRQDGAGTAEVREFTPGHYRIHYRCSSRSVMRVSNAWFPGWRATAGGLSLEVFPVDHALLGVVVPAGEGDLDLDYHSRFFLVGAIVSLSALLACAGLWARSDHSGSIPHPE